MNKHPATYTDALLPIFAELLLNPWLQCEPGTRAGEDFGPLRGYRQDRAPRAWLPQAEFYGYEIEPEWAEQARAAGCVCTTGDSRQMHYPDATFDAICTARPTATAWRITTRRATPPAPHLPPRAGRPLTPGNSGALQWGDGIAGDEYRALHVAVWTECRRVLKPGGIFVLNVKDHIRGGVLQEVSNWHAVTLLMLGFVCTRRVHVPCPGQRHGANGHLRVDYESVIQLRKAS